MPDAPLPEDAPSKCEVRSTCSNGEGEFLIETRAETMGGDQRWVVELSRPKEIMYTILHLLFRFDFICKLPLSDVPTSAPMLVQTANASIASQADQIMLNSKL